MLSGCHNHFQTILIKLNKILNKWTEENLPITSKILIQPKKKETEENTVFILRKTLKNLGIPEERFTIISPSKERTAGPILINTPFALFSLYLFDGTNDDNVFLDDTKTLNQQLKEGIKEIIGYIESIDKDKNVLQAILDTGKGITPFLLKIDILFYYFEYERNKEIPWTDILEYAKIGLALINLDGKLSPLHKKSSIKKYKNFIQQEILPSLLGIYTSIAYFLAFKRDYSTLDHVFSENYLNIATELHEQHRFADHTSRVFVMTHYYIKAKIAHDRGEFELFLACYKKGNKILEALRGTAFIIRGDPQFRMDCLLGDFHQERDPFLAMTHYRNALCQINDPSIHTSETITHELEEKFKLSQSKNSKLMKMKLKTLFPTSVVKTTEENISVFIRLENLPGNFQYRGDDIRYEFIDKLTEDSVTQIRGIKITVPLIPDHIEKMKALWEHIQKKCTPKEKKKKSLLSLSLPEPLLLADTNEMKVPEKTNLSEVSAETTTLKREKIKTRKKTTLPPNNSLPIPPKILRAHDFGFKAQNNPLITPVYCTATAQKNKSTCIFVAWRGIEKIDKETEASFKNMLNPTEEGIRIASLLNQAGPKLWKNPARLTDWKKCGLRFKAIGAAGSTRVVADAEEEIIVAQNGKEKKCYLFGLGKAISK